MNKPRLMPDERISYMMCVELPQINFNSGGVDPGAASFAAADYAI